MMATLKNDWKQIQSIANKSGITLTVTVICGSCDAQEAVVRPVGRGGQLKEWKLSDDMDLAATAAARSLFDLGWRDCNLGPDFRSARDFGSDNVAICCPTCIKSNLVKPVTHA